MGRRAPDATENLTRELEKQREVRPNVLSGEQAPQGTAVMWRVSGGNTADGWTVSIVGSDNATSGVEWKRCRTIPTDAALAVGDDVLGIQRHPTERPVLYPGGGGSGSASGLTQGFMRFFGEG
jgi:hypothetical protein